MTSHENPISLGEKMKVRVYRFNTMMEPEYITTVKLDSELVAQLSALLSEGWPVYLEPVMEK